MEIPSYASNIQPYGSQSGTKIASENDNAKSVSLSGDNSRSVSRTDKLSEHFSEQVRARQQESAETAMAQAKQRQRLNEEQLAKMVEQMNEFVKSINKGRLSDWIVNPGARWLLSTKPRRVILFAKSPRKRCLKYCAALPVNRIINPVY